MSNLTKITELNQEINTVCKSFFKEHNISYYHLYRNPFVKNSKNFPTHNIDGRSIKYYGCKLTKVQIVKLNASLKKYNVKCKSQGANDTTRRWLQAPSVRIVNI